MTRTGFLTLVYVVNVACDNIGCNCAIPSSSPRNDGNTPVTYSSIKARGVSAFPICCPMTYASRSFYGYAKTSLLSIIVVIIVIGWLGTYCVRHSSQKKGVEKYTKCFFFYLHCIGTRPPFRQHPCREFRGLVRCVWVPRHQIQNLVQDFKESRRALESGHHLSPCCQILERLNSHC
jgi:hypothetical protein